MPFVIINNYMLGYINVTVLEYLSFAALIAVEVVVIISTLGEFSGGCNRDRICPKLGYIAINLAIVYALYILYSHIQTLHRIYYFSEMCDGLKGISIPCNLFYSRIHDGTGLVYISNLLFFAIFRLSLNSRNLVK